MMNPYAEEELSFLTHKGERLRFGARFGPDREVPGRPARLARRVTLGVDWTVLQYRIPASATGDPDTHGALEREAAAAVALERRYGPERYGEVFTRVVGYDLEAPEPFVLYRVADGEPVGAHAGTLGVEEQHQVVAQLVLAVRLLEAAGLVHRAIGPDTVRWDGRHVRLSEPYAATRAGERRVPFGAAPWASPEQRDGIGAADPRDDLWSVAQLGYFLLAGRPDRGAGPPADLADFRLLAALDHGGAFAPLASGRRAPTELMRLLNVPDPLALTVGGGDDDGPARGHTDYDGQMARKRADILPQRPLREAPPQPPPARRVGWLRGRGSGTPALPEVPDTGTQGPGGLGTAFAPALPPYLVPSDADPDPERLCPHCLLPVVYDMTRLVTIDHKGDRIPLDLSTVHNPAHLADLERKAFQLCPHADGTSCTSCPCPTSRTAGPCRSPSSAARASARRTCSPRCWARSSRAP
ncbi:hypothetical protein [Streptomyces coeruleoprunus]|uniref:hypothetical protein n=1 Tax=Streptomyces coeruleoprunus TaxID=285563 RepID=UPI0031E97A53